MKPAGIEFLRTAMRSVAAAKTAEPFSRELRDDLEYEEQLRAALIAEATERRVTRHPPPYSSISRR